jgi:hypothetical protein
VLTTYNEFMSTLRGIKPYTAAWHIDEAHAIRSYFHGCELCPVTAVYFGLTGSRLHVGAWDRAAAHIGLHPEVAEELYRASDDVRPYRDFTRLDLLDALNLAPPPLNDLHWHGYFARAEARR